MLKRYVLALASRSGYRILKAADHDALLAHAAHGNPSAPPAAAPTGWRSETLRAAARYLRDSEVAGDIVDCGNGLGETLIVLGAALVQLGDTSRRLVLFDTTADPLHRAERELELWGSDRDLLAKPGRPKVDKPEPPPADIEVTGYPRDNIDIMRYPREPIACSRPIAFLGLTTASYDANRTAIATFLPHLARGGVVGVESDWQTKQDAVADYLARERTRLLLVNVAQNYRIGIKT
jgi:hypothetical protein